MKKERRIMIDGRPVPVSEAVYSAFKRPAWVERKRRKTRAERERSLEAFMDSGFDIPSGQALVDELVEDKLLLDILMAALDELTDDERDLVYSLFYNGMTEREVASQYAISHQAVHKRKRHVLEKLREILVGKE